MHMAVSSTCDAPPGAEIDFAAFAAVDIRAGTILSAEAFPEARKPAYRLLIDFGAGVGVKKSSAQITEQYPLEALPGRRVMAVVNFPPRQIGPMRSEVLVLGFPDGEGRVRLAEVPEGVANGARLF